MVKISDDFGESTIKNQPSIREKSYQVTTRELNQIMEENH